MSRLDSFIRRLEAQRRCLDFAAEVIAEVPGPVFELGLGHGRTFDHLRSLFPDREVFVFERKVDLAAALQPPSEALFLGDIRETLPASIDRFGDRVALVHADIGTGDPALNAEIAQEISAQLSALLAPGGIVVADQVMSLRGTDQIGLPEGVARGRYNLYQRALRSAD